MGMFSFLKGDSANVPSDQSKSAGDLSADAPAPLDTSALTAPPAEAKAEVAGAASVGPLDPDNTAAFQQLVIDQIKTVFDPEIPVDIYELGLIYDIIVDADKRVLINMTLTSPACPSAQQIPSEVRWKVKAIPGVADAFVEIVWEPAWSKERMSEAAKLTLGFF
jgi:FeS assembly SUF system protein